MANLPSSIGVVVRSFRSVRSLRGDIRFHLRNTVHIPSTDCYKILVDHQVVGSARPRIREVWEPSDLHCEEAKENCSTHLYDASGRKHPHHILERRYSLQQAAFVVVVVAA